MKLNFCEILFIIFLVLKLTNVITWSWWWVTAPLWAPYGLILLLLFIVALFGTDEQQEILEKILSEED